MSVTRQNAGKGEAFVDRQGREEHWRQHFPTYHFADRDIALEEYSAAAKNLESEERVFLNAANIGVVSFAAIGSLLVGSLDRLEAQVSPILPSAAPGVLLLLLTAIISWVTLRYFADRQRAIVFAARKVIVLRRMLGLSYGTVQLVLPNWRVEGADEPFAVRLFPGWRTYVGYPFFALAAISSVVVFFLMVALLLSSEKRLPPSSASVAVGAVSALWGGLLAYVYRTNLLDIHERPLLLLARNLAAILRVRVAPNVEQILYRATLARYEFLRLKIDLVNVFPILLFVEDRGFYQHRGVSLRAVTRATLALLKLKRRSGGSTITQQLCRTLLIQDLHKLYRRKILEIVLAIWFDSVFGKRDQIELYLAAVRFERGVFGILSAMRYFWGGIVQRPSRAQAFFLIERVSNIRSGLMGERVAHLLIGAVTSGLLASEEIGEVFTLYRRAIDDGKVVDRQGQLALLKSSLKSHSVQTE